MDVDSSIYGIIIYSVIITIGACVLAYAYMMSSYILKIIFGIIGSIIFVYGLIQFYKFWNLYHSNFMIPVN